MTFEYADWSTRPLSAGIGLRKGCPAAPMFFRWGLTDCMASLHEGWVCLGHGAHLDTVTVSHAAWAEDTWAFDGTQHGLEGMLQDLAREAGFNTGVAIRWAKCGYAQAYGPLSAPLTCRHHASEDRTAWRERMPESRGENERRERRRP